MAVESELTGVVQKTVKALSPYMLELDGATDSLYLRGEVLQDIPDNTRIWAKGTIQTLLFDNRNDPSPAMMRRQWHIYMNVTECKRIATPFQRPKELTPNPVIVALRSKMEQELTQLDPNELTFEIPESSMGHTLVVRYKTRQYIIHPTSKTGRISETAVIREGPSDNGFLLRVHVQRLGKVNQADVPQTIRQPYWSLDLQAYEIKNADKQIYVALSYNTNTDKKLIRKLRAITKECGTPYSPMTSAPTKR